MWSPEGQLPYECIKIKKKIYMYVACKLLTKPPPPPPHCSDESVLKPGQCRGQSASLALPSFGLRQGF